MRATLGRLLVLLPLTTGAGAQSIEVHHVLELPGSEDKVVALTLDACGGAYDADLLNFLVERRIAATVFVTGKWLARHPQAVSVLLSHPELFDVENHGELHVPAIIGAGRTLQGMAGSQDVAHLEREVSGGARAVEAATGRAPRWYRGAGGEYDPEALEIIASIGLRVAGFSINADDGATLNRRQVIRRLQRVESGDIIIAHLNKPESDTAEGLTAGLPALLARGFRFVPLRDAKVQSPADAIAARLRRAGQPGGRSQLFII
jgi:peptidoglycan/xylan/chitin deacetylase (PgdA/CDA1 family)